MEENHSPSPDLSCLSIRFGRCTDITPRFKKQFASYLADDIGSDDIEEMYTSAYEAIREDPEFKPTEKDVAKWKKESLARKQHKLTKAERESKVQEKIAAYKAGRGIEEDEDEEDDE